MAVSKRQGRFAFAPTTGPAATASPAYVLACDDAEIIPNPVHLQRKNLGLDEQKPLLAGFDLAFRVTNAEVSMEALACLYYLAYGSDTYTTTHAIALADDAPYCQVFVDRKVDLGGGASTSENAVGGVVTKLTVKASRRDFILVDIEGVACNYGSWAAAITAAAPAVPLSFTSISSVTLGYNGGATSIATGIQSFEVAYQRTVNTDDGLELNGTQPTAIVAHGRTIDVSIERKLEGAVAATEYAAWKAHYDVEAILSLAVGTDALDIAFPQMHFLAEPYVGPVGTGDEMQKGMMKLRAHTETGFAVSTVAYDGDPAASFEP